MILNEWIAVVVVVLVVLWIVWAKLFNQCREQARNSDVKTDKWFLAVTVGLLAIAFNSPLTYCLTGKATCGFTADERCTPTPAGLVLHNVLLMLSVRVLLS